MHRVGETDFLHNPYVEQPQKGVPFSELGTAQRGFGKPFPIAHWNVHQILAASYIFPARRLLNFGPGLGWSRSQVCLFGFFESAFRARLLEVGLHHLLHQVLEGEAVRQRLPINQVPRTLAQPSNKSAKPRRREGAQPRPGG